MDSRIIAFLGLFLVTVIGFFAVRLTHRNLLDRKRFISEFLEVFGRFSEPQEFHPDAYEWLIRESVAMQRELGEYGIVAYQPPWQQVLYTRYEIIVNLLPELRRTKIRANQGLHRRYDTYLEMVAIYLETILRYLGVLDREIGRLQTDLWNPFTWFREGIQVIMLVPVLIIHWFGFIGATTVWHLKSSGLFRVIGSIFALVSFLSGITGIFVRWAQFKQMVVDLWNQLF